MNPAIAWLDDLGKPAWIALMIVSFIAFWPAGFLVLGYLIGSGRMGCWTYHRGERWQRRFERMQQRAANWYGPQQGWGQRQGQGQSSGNWAFDEYRAETLRRLEEEQREFNEYLDRLRRAKDKVEFDQFMAELRNRPAGPAPELQPGV